MDKFNNLKIILDGIHNKEDAYNICTISNNNDKLSKSLLANHYYNPSTISYYDFINNLNILLYTKEHITKDNKNIRNVQNRTNDLVQLECIKKILNSQK